MVENSCSLNGSLFNHVLNNERIVCYSDDPDRCGTYNLNNELLKVGYLDCSAIQMFAIKIPNVLILKQPSGINYFNFWLQ